MKPPRYLYRYMSFKYLESILAHKTLYFCDSAVFNDPFDCKATFSADGVGGAIEKKRIAFEEVLRDMSAKWGILCLSEIPDDILMWAHYSDGHRGVVLRFLGAGLSELGSCRNVQYHDSLVDYRAFEDAWKEPGKQFEQFVLRKSWHWEYEREWRVVDKGVGFKKFAPEMLTASFLAARRTPAIRRKYKNIERSMA